MKMKIYHTVTRLPRIGLRIPESWVKFEKVIQHWMVDKGIKFATLDEMFDSYPTPTTLGRFHSGS